MRRASSAARVRAAGSAPFSPITSSPRSTSAAATWRAAASGIGSTNSGCGANGAVRITTPTGSPVASSVTVSHQRGYDGCRLARLDLRHRPGRHGGDDGAEHRVGLEQATRTDQEVARVLGELERELHPSDVSGTLQTTSRSTPDSVTSRARTPACWGGPKR